MTSRNQLLAPILPASLQLWIAAVAFLISSGAAGYQFLQADRVAHQLRLESIALHVPPPQKPQLSKLEVERNQQWMELAVERSFNWYPIFQALERASGSEVELLEFEPDKANHQIVLRGEARSMEALVAYLSKLSEQDIIQRAYLTHQRSASRQSLKTVSFELKASLTK